VKERCTHTVKRQRARIQALEDENFLLRLTATEWASRYYDLLNSLQSVKGGNHDEPSSTSS
jgi:hypothetical protein